MSFRYIADVPHDEPLPLICVDLGYSAKRKSSGLACTGWDAGHDATFGDACREVAREVRNLWRPDRSPVVVLEAPLSTRHDAEGNPAPRGTFERGRGWYHQPGAAVCLAALRFLHVVADELLPEINDVYLAEAFLSNKAAEARKRPHWHDAVRIRDAFRQTRPVALLEDVEPLCPLISGVPSVRVFDAIEAT